MSIVEMNAGKEEQLKTWETEDTRVSRGTGFDESLNSSSPLVPQLYNKNSGPI